MGRGPIALIAAAVLAALLLAGCGGSSDDSSGKAISKEEFIAKADAICKQSNERMEKKLFLFLRKSRAAAGGALRKPTVDQNEKFIATVLIPNLKQEIKELEALGVPQGDEEKVDAMIAALQEGLETAEDQTRTVAAGTADMVFGIASRLAGEYGLETCGAR